MSEWLVDPVAVGRLTRLDMVLRDHVAGPREDLAELSLHLLARGGKRLRPALVFLAADGDQVVDERSVLAGAAILELLHVASLYHDDVMDRAEERRGVPSANAVWGNSVAAAGGIYLLTRAIALLVTLSEGIQRLVANATTALATGQLREAENSYNLRLSEAEHLEILRLKTGTLFELPCRLGAELAGAPASAVEALAAYGRELGLAFQLTDDALDLAGHPARLGKPVAADIREGVYSLPILRLLASEGPDGPLAALLGRTHLEPAEIAAAIDLVRASGAIEETRALAASHADRAVEAIAGLPDGPARRSLVNLARYAVERDL
jgi:geranylgeranyl pyrophosphate synthase